LSGGRQNKRLIPNATIPQSANIKDYLDVIERLPDTDDSSFFGLPANIERTAQRVNSLTVTSQLKTLMRNVQVGAKFDRDAWNTELSPILQLWKKLNQGSGNIIHAKLEAPQVTDDEAVKQFILLERYNAVKLVQKIHHSLAAISKVIRGTHLLTPEVQSDAGAIMEQTTPMKWVKMWAGPDDPMQYLHALVAKTMALQGWVEKVERGSLLSSEVNLSDLFHPNTFLNAIRQKTARLSKVSMDELRLVCSWIGKVNGAKYQVKVCGLQIEGCVFDGSRLSENQRDSTTVSTVPPFNVAWIPKTSPGPYASGETISLPIYTSSTRESIITCIDVPQANTNTNSWIQCGAAMILQQN